MKHPNVNLKPAVFLDRDDTLIANRELAATMPYPGDLFNPELVDLLPEVPHSLRRLKEAGHLLVVVTNQGAVARGHCAIADVEATNHRMREHIRRDAGVELDAVYFCPYHPGGSVPQYSIEHPWRKPAPGMLLQAASDLAIDITRSWMIGDASRDIEAALAAGIPHAHTIILGTASARAMNRAATFSDAAELILGTVDRG